MRRWTMKEDERLQELAKAGEDARAIADALGRSVEEVYERAAKLGLVLD